MKRISLRLIIALFTFFTGITVFGFWMFYGNVPDVPEPELISLEERNFWENKILVRFNEESFESAATLSDESYRFTLFPTFHAPVSIRVRRSGDERLLITKKLSGLGGFGIDETGSLSYEKTRPLTEEEWLTFTHLLDRSDFWNMPRLDKDEIPVFDGASWFMEGVKDNQYHMIYRTLPDKEFLESCVYLLKLSGLEAEYKNYWR